MLRNFVVNSLAKSARRVIATHKPEIIAITGSVGKSSTKEAVGIVLGTSFSVRVSPKNFNSEIGLPLAVLNLPNGFRSSFKWLSILWKAKSMSRKVDADFPKVLVLEMGIEHPGDMAHLLGIAPPNIGVVTGLAEVHAEFFGSSVEGIAQEKEQLIAALPEDGVAILNRDDERVWAMREKTKAKVISYGFHPEADIRAHEDSIAYEVGGVDELGMRVRISGSGEDGEVEMYGLIGSHSLYAPLAAVAVGMVKGMSLTTIAEALKKYQPPAGRMRLLPGIKHTALIDDTYNAAPKAMMAALRTLAEYPVADPDDDKKIAVLGDMLELGALSDECHRQVGEMAAKSKVALLVLVGERMGMAEGAAVKAGMSPSQVFHFATAEEAGRFVQERMKLGDVILVKGSQGMRMEKVVKELMAEPMLAAELLVRQDAEWEA